MEKKTKFLIITISIFIIFGCKKENSTFVPEHSQFKIFINEVGVNPNWIELYNNEDTAVNLNGFQMFVDYKNNIKIKNAVIPAKGYIIFNLSLNQGGNNLPIIIDNKKGTVYLEDPVKKQVDKLEFSNLVDGKSFGRLPDGGNEYFYFEIPTPMKSNYTFLMPNQPPIIKDVSFSPINPFSFQEVTVTASIYDDYKLISAKLIYFDDDSIKYESNFSNTCCDPRKLEAKIKGFPSNTSISFYIKAVDDSSSVSYYPDGVPLIKMSYIVSEKK